MILVVGALVLIITHNYFLAGLRGDGDAVTAAEQAADDAERRLLAPSLPPPELIADLPTIEELLPREPWPISGADQHSSLSEGERDRRAKLLLIDEAFRSAEGFPYGHLAFFSHSPAVEVPEGLPAGVQALDVSAGFEGLSLAETVALAEWAEATAFVDIHSISYERTSSGSAAADTSLDVEAVFEDALEAPQESEGVEGAAALSLDDTGDVSARFTFYYLPGDTSDSEPIVDDEDS